MTSATSTGVTPKKVYRVVAVAEVVTWSLLIIAMILRYGFDIHEAIFPVGLTHGYVFIAYAVTTVIVGLNQRWRFGTLAIGVVLAIVPFATVPFERWVEKRGLLEGDWRSTSEGGPIDRLLVWFLARPILLVATVFVGVTVVVAALLVIGPPGG